MRQPLYAHLLHENQRLRHKIQHMIRCARWHILTNVGLCDAVQTLHVGVYDVVYADLDRLHEANEHLGHDEVDRRMRHALAVRETDVVIAGRWLSGDELVFLVPAGDGAKTAKRLQITLKAVGLSATWVVIPADVIPSYGRAIARAMACVEHAKRMQLRGYVFIDTWCSP